MAAGLDFGVLRERDTWKGFGVGVVLFCIIGYSSLSLFGLSSSAYGVSDVVEVSPDFEVESMNRTGIDDAIADDSGMIRLSDLRGSVIVLDFMAVDCANCHYVQEHIDQRIEEWGALEGEYPVVALSVATWYAYEDFDRINSTFGDSDSDKHMSWPVANGGPDSVILDDGTRGDLVEHYFAQAIPLVLVIDHEGYAVAKEGTGTPLDGWSSFDSAIERANEGDAESLRFGIEKPDSSMAGVFLICLLYTSPSPRD